MKESWRPGGQLGGTPARSDPGPPALAPVVIHELLTASTPPAVDTVELFNPATNAVDLGGWFLTDDFNTPMKYRRVTIDAAHRSGLRCVCGS